MDIKQDCYLYTVTIKNLESNEKTCYDVVAKTAIQSIEFIIKSKLGNEDSSKFMVSSEYKTDIEFGFLNATDKDVENTIDLKSIDEKYLKIHTFSTSEHQVFYLRFGRYIKIGSKFDKFHEAEFFLRHIKNDKQFIQLCIKKDIVV